MTLFYLNQGYLSYKDGKKVFYSDIFIIRQVTPASECPDDLANYTPKSDEIKIIRPKFDVTFGQILDLVETLGYLTVRGDMAETFFDYGYSKNNSKVLYSIQKMKIPSSFSGTMFRKHNMQHESGALSDTDFSQIYFFLPATTDVNQNLHLLSLNPIDIDLAEFCKGFNSACLDFNDTNREKKNRESVLKVLKKMVEISKSNIKRNADGLHSRKRHSYNSVEWISGRRMLKGHFALTY